MKKIAILGATGHLAKSLIYNFKKSTKYKLYLFARDSEKLDNFLKFINYNKKIEKISLNDFADEKYNAIINCIGIGDPGKLKNIGSEIFIFTEYYDNFILSYLKNNKDCLYLNFSSGAAYGGDFSVPAYEEKYCEIDINHIYDKDNYGIIKIYLEAKHRSYFDFNIIDLRIFNFFSRFINLNSKYFITELINCIKTDSEFKTDKNNIIRDFVHPTDLFNLIILCINTKSINDTFDVYSLNSVTKFEILDYFVKKYNLRYTIQPGLLDMDDADNKKNYYSNYKKARNIGYIPKYTSMDSIADEAAEILKNI